MLWRLVKLLMNNLVIVSLTTGINSKTNCSPRAPCTSCNFLSKEVNRPDCQIYHYCYYGRLFMTKSCGYNKIYSSQQGRCIPSNGSNECSSETPHGARHPPSPQPQPLTSQPPSPPSSPPPLQYMNGRVAGRRSEADYPTDIINTVSPSYDSTNRVKLAEKCGIKVSSYIIGGQGADRAEWAWQVSLQALDKLNRQYIHICGGTIINPSWVLTAAHCVHNSQYKLYWIAVAGQYQLDSSDPWRQIRRVGKIVAHPQYSHQYNYPNDIALLRLSKPFNISTAVRPACLPSDDDLEDLDAGDPNCWTTGWGQSRGDDPYTLREISVRLVDLWKCRLGWPGYIKPFHICAVSKNGIACKGDSGGPLVCVKKGLYYIQGIVSWGDGKCELRDLPSVYTRVANYTHWIHDNIYTP